MRRMIAALNAIAEGIRRRAPAQAPPVVRAVAAAGAAERRGAGSSRGAASPGAAAAPSPRRLRGDPPSRHGTQTIRVTSTCWKT